MSSLRILPLLCLFLLYSSFCWAALMNSTVDDTSPDSRGAKIRFFPPDAWNFGSGCKNSPCWVQLDTNQLYQGTWHESIFSAGERVNGHANQVLNVTLGFSGTALYVYCVLARTTTRPAGNSDMTFYIDGQFVGALQKPAPGTSGYDYDVPVYVNTTLSHGFHTFVLQNGHPGNPNSLVILDRIVYSYDNESSTTTSSDPVNTSSAGSSQNSSSTNIAVIVGPAVAIPLAAILLGFIYYMRRRRRQRSFIPETAEVSLVTPYMLSQSSSGNTTPSPSPSPGNSSRSKLAHNPLAQASPLPTPLIPPIPPPTYSETFAGPQTSHCHHEC
ncbi:hypothetical protein D9758_006727 [Tetrapyrgos nigripes]|uniref:Uncharacterized protein n=1 Tax=Tetrapyrgos nigripes TaxID=182062 RepID=A0A8H5GJN4_9AGAR|nr:hypothetical protein D9758_006727 [Tetrapyrgos nigripes]